MPAVDSRQAIEALLAEPDASGLIGEELDGVDLQAILNDLRDLPPAARDTAVLALESPSTVKSSRCG
jgi:hypothetical protein